MFRKTRIRFARNLKKPKVRKIENPNRIIKIINLGKLFIYLGARAISWPIRHRRIPKKSEILDRFQSFETAFSSLYSLVFKKSKKEPEKASDVKIFKNTFNFSLSGHLLHQMQSMASWPALSVIISVDFSNFYDCLQSIHTISNYFYPAVQIVLLLDPSLTDHQRESLFSLSDDYSKLEFTNPLKDQAQVHQFLKDSIRGEFVALLRDNPLIDDGFISDFLTFLPQSGEAKLFPALNDKMLMFEKLLCGTRSDHFPISEKVILLKKDWLFRQNEINSSVEPCCGHPAEGIQKLNFYSLMVPKAQFQDFRCPENPNYLVNKIGERNFRVLYIFKPHHEHSIMRYRAFNLIEALKEEGIDAAHADEDFLEDSLQECLSFDLIVLVRRSWTPALARLTELTRAAHIPVVVDFDDFIFDEKIIPNLALAKTLTHFEMGVTGLPLRCKAILESNL